PPDLAHVADLAAHFVLLAADVVAGHPRFARVDWQQRGQHAENGRLAGSVGTEEAEDLASADLEIDPANRLDRLSAQVKRLPQVPGYGRVVNCHLLWPPYRSS